MGLQRRLSGVYMGAPPCGSRPKIVLSLVKSGPQTGGFRLLRGLKFLFSNPETARLCAEPRRLTYYAWKAVRVPWLWSVGKTPNSISFQIHW